MPEQINTSTPQRTRRPGQRMTAVQRKATQEVFLQAFSMTANVRASCLKAGIDRSLVYQWQEHDDAFSFKFKQAELDANDMIRGELFRRAVQGVDEPVISVGKLVYVEDKNKKMVPLTIKKYSDSLLSLLAKARMPEFRDQSKVDVNAQVTTQSAGTLNIDTRNMTQEELSQLKALAMSMKARQG
jgi:hypothetical protein